jgi:hypothetical protein
LATDFWIDGDTVCGHRFINRQWRSFATDFRIGNGKAFGYRLWIDSDIVCG